MGYRIDIDFGNCLTCGICMDVCPVEALDMRRPQTTGVEGEPANPWLMETPVQVGECIGCAVCVRECPVHVMTLATDDTGPALARRQGPIAPPPPTSGWVPLSALTRESLKRDHPSPFDPFEAWRTGGRGRPTADWSSERGPAPSARDGHIQDAAAPCQAACPAGTDAGLYVGLIAQGRFDDAYAVAAEVNPFPSVCGWICTAPCEIACRRDVLDEAIAIRTLKRFAVEYGRLPDVPAPSVQRHQRVAIVGGGPAGMSAAYYLARLGYPVVVFEAMPVPGGMMAIGIPEYRLPREVLRGEIERIVGLGVELRLNAAMGRDFTLLDLEREGFAAVFLATGASRSRPLDVPGDDLEGVVPATLFLKRVNLGEEPRLDGPVAVVGGGSTAMDAARSALRSGASSVTVLYRRGRDDMPAQREELEAAEREGIVIRPSVAVSEVVGHNGRVVGLRLLERRLVTGSRTDWQDVAGSESLVHVSTVLVAIGEEPDPSILPEGTGIGITASAGIVADPRSLSTGRPGVFAGGDVVSGAKTVIDAVSAGRRAAGSVHEYLAGVPNGEAAVMEAVRYPRTAEPQLVLDLGTRSRERPPVPVFVAGSFAATQAGFDPTAATREASRCFRCDAIDACRSVTVIAGRGPERATPYPPPATAAASTPATVAPVAAGAAASSNGASRWTATTRLPRHPARLSTRGGPS
jgi:NADPH-dependent glutamate synthase beta subunit-like oxidoreductase/Pyruvate/2-oxoacid:ferredoxin oxidoreductase delta subunit